MPCVPPRWKAGWKSWECCGPSPDQGLATTTHTPNRFSAQQNTGPITQGGHSPAWKRHACGWRHLWIGTTTGTATAASSSLRHTSDTVAKPWRSAGIVPMSMNRHASGIHVAGHDPLVAGVNRKWSGSIHHPRKSNINQLHLLWLPDQQQRRHLSWQSPPRPAELPQGCCNESPWP